MVVDFQNRSSGDWWSLDDTYTNQQVIGEEHSDPGLCRNATYYLSFSPVARHTVRGVVYLNGAQVQTFNCDPSGKIQAVFVEPWIPMLVSGQVDDDGRVALNWNHPPGPCIVKYDYEYAMEAFGKRY